MTIQKQIDWIRSHRSRQIDHQIADSLERLLLVYNEAKKVSVSSVQISHTESVVETNRIEDLHRAVTAVHDEQDST